MTREVTPERVLVTGANGFVGRALCERLLRDGYRVRAVVRRESTLSSLPAGVECVVADLEQPLSDALLAMVDRVVHLAARVHAMREDPRDVAARYEAANVDATARLVAASARTGVRRFVLVSTVKVHGEGRVGVLRPDTPLAPQGPYAASKAKAEQVLRDTAGVMEWAIVRPTFVFGEGGKGNFPRLVSLTRIAARLPVPLGSIRNRRSLVYVGNLASLLSRCLEHPGASGQSFIAADPESPSTTGLIQRLGRALGVRPKLWPCPVWLLRAGAAVVRRGEEMERLTESLEVDAGNASRLLDWQPPYSLDDALRRSVSGVAS